MAEGHIQGGIAQGVAPALFEEIAYDDNGNWLTGSLIC
jgi:carbon-monoxide dehydrogenase large subunit